MADFFKDVVEEPPNNILGVAQECKNDSYHDKINLVIGAYRTEEGKPYVLPAVREAEEVIHAYMVDHEYLVQDGFNEFNHAAQKLMFGDESRHVLSHSIYTIQAVAGTGAVRLGSDLVKSILPETTSFIPDVTWGNHSAILKSSGNKHSTYRYLDAAGTGFNYDGMLEDLRAMPERSVVVLHSCAHNPTGVDPTDEQWLTIRDIVKERNLLPFFDNAYQGFVSGDVNKDAFAVRSFAEAEIELLVACSFSKNFGLYGERIGALHVLTKNAHEAHKVGSVLRALSRVLYSTCPTHGARIVSTILNDAARRKAWEEQCAAMANRLNTIRADLYHLLKEKNVKGTWEHIIRQRGMFTFSGIPKDAVEKLKKEHHVFLLTDGRVSLAGLNRSNLHRFVDALVTVLGTN